jgi:hypothetical protein
MPIEPVRLSPHELSLLQALESGRRPAITSSHRTRLELLGLIRDGPAGPQLTAEGYRRAGAITATVEPEKLARSSESVSAPRDVRGRRKRGRRTLPI